VQGYKMWIDGQWMDAASGKTYSVFNPATEEAIAQVPLGGKADVDMAVQAARKAFLTWRKTTRAQRAEVLNRIARSMKEHSSELAELDILDHGTPKKWLMVLLPYFWPQTLHHTLPAPVWWFRVDYL
jgi:acyl-CoA reductase-like NAD-dependent aldehyde dehydrogenase